MTSPAPAPEIDAEDLVIAYLGAQYFLPAAQVAAKMPAQLALPFVLVRRVAGGDDYIVDYPTIQIDTFHSDQTSASTTARMIHHAMRRLRPKIPVTMPDGTTANVYKPTETEQTPIFMEYQPSSGGGAVAVRYVSRYCINVRLPSIASF